MKKSPSILSVIFTTEKKAFDDWVLGLKPREGLRERTWARPLLCVWVGVKPRVGADVDGSIFCFQFYGGEEINTCIGNNLFYGTTRFNHRKGHEMNGLHTRPPIWRVIFYLLYIHPKLRQREDYSKWWGDDRANTVDFQLLRTYPFLPAALAAPLTRRSSLPPSCAGSCPHPRTSAGSGAATAAARGRRVRGSPAPGDVRKGNAVPLSGVGTRAWQRLVKVAWQWWEVRWGLLERDGEDQVWPVLLETPLANGSARHWLRPTSFQHYLGLGCIPYNDKDLICTRDL